MKYDFDAVVIGAGAVGLSVAMELAGYGLATGLLEKNKRYGLETSSRNSEVMHSGIHYPASSLKAKLCVEGNALLYEYCSKKGILHEKTGKITVAVENGDLEKLESLYRAGVANGVGGMCLLGNREAIMLQPGIKCKGGLFTGTTGLVNAHQLMDSLYSGFIHAGGLAGFGEEATGISSLGGGYEIYTGSAGSESYRTRIVVNCAGLFADRISAMAGAKYQLYWAKGDYFSICGVSDVKLPVYPLPGKDFLGIHLTPLPGGGLRAGPDIEYVEKRWPPYPDEAHPGSYRVCEEKRELFYREISSYLPGLQPECLVPEMYGIRPKLQGPSDDFRDFAISEDLPGFVNLVGIESPGLTSCLAIGRHVLKMVKARL